MSLENKIMHWLSAGAIKLINRTYKTGIQLPHDEVNIEWSMM